MQNLKEGSKYLPLPPAANLPSIISPKTVGVGEMRRSEKVAEPKNGSSVFHTWFPINHQKQSLRLLSAAGIQQKRYLLIICPNTYSPK